MNYQKNKGRSAQLPFHTVSLYGSCAKSVGLVTSFNFCYDNMAACTDQHYQHSFTVSLPLRDLCWKLGSPQLFGPFWIILSLLLATIWISLYMSEGTPKRSILKDLRDRFYAFLRPSSHLPITASARADILAIAQKGRKHMLRMPSWQISSTDTCVVQWTTVSMHVTASSVVYTLYLRLPSAVS